MASPSFSIIVPTYQRRDMVCEAVSALSRLSYDGPIEPDQTVTPDERES